jgi:plasmid replication initiation protein
MIMNDINSIVICKDEYKTKEDFENAIKDAVMVLLNNNYIMTVRYDEKGLGIVAIEFNYADQSLGDTYPYWLTVEQAENVFYE